VDDADLVRGQQARGHLLRDGERTRNRQLALVPQDVREVGPFDVGHRDVLDAVQLAEIVDADDVLVRDLARKQQLALEASLDGARGRGIGGHLRLDDLDGDRDAQLGVPGLIDGAHAADAEQLDDVVARSEGLAWRERAGVAAGSGVRGARPAGQGRALGDARREG